MAKQPIARQRHHILNNDTPDSCLVNFCWNSLPPNIPETQTPDP